LESFETNYLIILQFFRIASKQEAQVQIT